MWFQTVSKKQLGDLLERPSQPVDLFGGSEHAPDQPPRNGEFVLVWPARPEQNEVPTAIVVENTQRRDLLAWAASYASSYRPFTAHLHVINLLTCHALLQKTRPRPTERGIAAAVGAVLGEALSSAPPKPELTVNECARTFAYAMGRTYALGLASQLAEEITSAWSVFASLTNPHGRPELAPYQRPWMALITASTQKQYSASSDDTVRAVRELYETGELASTTLYALQSRWPMLSRLLPMLRDTREIRVSAFQSFVQELAHLEPGRDNSSDAPFVVGFVASRLAPGSLEYFRLLRPLESLLPGVLVWYGICAALQGGDFIAGSGGLGRRLYRDLSAAETFPGRPRADISVWDLEVFARSESTPLSMLGNTSFSVELAPDVVCIASTRTSAATVARATSQRSPGPDAEAIRDALPPAQRELPMTSYELTSLLEELRQALTRVSNVQYKLERLTGRLDTTSKSNRGKQRK